MALLSISILLLAQSPSAYALDDILQELDDNGVTSPFYGPLMYPQGYYYNGSTYIVWNAVKGGESTSWPDPYITYFDHSTQTIGPKVKVDDGPLFEDSHGNPVLMINSTGFIYVFYGAHSAEPQKWAVSNYSEDITEWTLKGNFETDITYPNLVRNETDFYVFYRITISANRRGIAYKLSTDGGETFGSPVTVVDSLDTFWTYHFNMEFVDDRIHMAWTSENKSSGQREDIYYAYLNGTDGDMYAIDDTSLGAIITIGELDTVRVEDTGTLETSYGALHLDAAGIPYLMYPFEEESDGNWTVHFTRWTGSAWASEIVTSTDARGNYPDFIVRSSTSLEAYLTTDGLAGGGGDIERWDWDGNTWTQVAAIRTESAGGVAMDSPKIIRNFREDLRVVFTEVNDDWSSAELKVFIFGAEGPRSLPSLPIYEYGVLLLFSSFLVLTLAGAWTLKKRGGIGL